MFEALFIMTLIDAGTRVGRYLLQELLGHFHPKFNDQHWAPWRLWLCSFNLYFVGLPGSTR